MSFGRIMTFVFGGGMLAWVASHPVESMEIVSMAVSAVKDLISISDGEEDKKEKDPASQSQVANGNENMQQSGAGNYQAGRDLTVNNGVPYSTSSFYNPKQSSQLNGNGLIEKIDLQGKIDEQVCAHRNFLVKISIENHQSPKPTVTVECGSSFTIKDVEGIRNNTVRYTASALDGRLVDSDNFTLWGTMDTNIVNLKKSRN
ncbi:hypothetical protein [Thiothrix winogradskyi]|uniref:Uncharacterized protein n=1 Tax=Thiothrix winogradskyi TaxID=96472 RepID=A0ABY3T1Y3_9GAMM|nr:hypothetical protein [Thiothrix winogradskyi]UJS25229.1 hypothetical protein L2Y54_04090 [Thiothrix winogradskyi]